MAPPRWRLVTGGHQRFRSPGKYFVARSTHPTPVATALCVCVHLRKKTRFSAWNTIAYTKIPRHPSATATHRREQARDGLPQVVHHVARVDDEQVAQARRVSQHQHRHGLPYEPHGGKLAASSDQRAIYLKMTPRVVDGGFLQAF